MPDIPVGSQIFDLAFHPTSDIVYTGLLTGNIKAHSYNEQGAFAEEFDLRPSKRSCRGLALNADGTHLWAVGMAKALQKIDTATGQLLESRKDVHERVIFFAASQSRHSKCLRRATINRVKQVMPHMVATGDDDGIIKLWDPRTPECIRTYEQHFDFISDFHCLNDKKQLIASSGDGTLSVMDVRSKKTEPFAQSEDQEDELLSMVSIKKFAILCNEFPAPHSNFTASGTKLVVGTQLGILSIFNRSKGWGDCVDRVPGHPSSIDALCALPSSYPSSNSTILTGSSDGLLRAVQLLPTKLIGVVADHGSFPIERIAVDRGGEGRWVGSVGHEEVLKLTDLRDVFEDEDEGDAEEAQEGSTNPDSDSDNGSSDDEGEETPPIAAPASAIAGEKKDEAQDIEEGDDQQASSEEEEEAIVERKRKRKPEKNPLATNSKRGRNQLEAEPTFFSEL